MSISDENEGDYNTTLKKKKTKTSTKKDTVYGRIKIDDLLDIEFFENCFFGKKLSVKDQLIFKIYA